MQKISFTFQIWTSEWIQLQATEASVFIWTGEGWKKHSHRICAGKKELESWKVETFQYAHSDMPAANRQLARTLLCAANMLPRGLSNKVSDECICSPLWKFMRAFVVRYVNFNEHSYFCNFHAYYIRNWDIGFSIGHSRNCSNTVRFMLVCFMYICLFASPFPCSARILLSKNLKHKGSPPTFALMAP